MIDNDTIERIVSGATGAGVAAWLAKATGLSLAVMFFGGLSAAYFFGPFVTEQFKLPERYESAMGWVVGFVSILALRKVYDMLESVPAKQFGALLMEWGRKWLGLPPAPKDDTKESEK